MASTLYIEEAVVTGDILSRRHGDESEVYIADSAIVTPTGWDYLRQHRVQLSRGEVPEVPQHSSDDSSDTPKITEIQPPQMDGSGRCEQPERSCGCQTEEFGSGYVERLSNTESDRVMDEIVNRYLKTVKSGHVIDPEQLVREITSLVLHRLEG